MCLILCMLNRVCTLLILLVTCISHIKYIVKVAACSLHTYGKFTSVIQGIRKEVGFLSWNVTHSLFYTHPLVEGKSLQHGMLEGQNP